MRPGKDEFGFGRPVDDALEDAMDSDRYPPSLSKRSGSLVNRIVGGAALSQGALESTAELVTATVARARNNQGTRQGLKDLTTSVVDALGQASGDQRMAGFMEESMVSILDLLGSAALAGSHSGGMSRTNRMNRMIEHSVESFLPNLVRSTLVNFLVRMVDRSAEKHGVDSPETRAAAQLAGSLMGMVYIITTDGIVEMMRTFDGETGQLDDSTKLGFRIAIEFAHSEPGRQALQNSLDILSAGEDNGGSGQDGESVK